MRKIYIDNVNLIAFLFFALVVPFTVLHLTGIKYKTNAFSVVFDSQIFYTLAYFAFTYICFSFLSFKNPKTYESLFIIIAFGGFFLIFSFLAILFQTDSVVREHVVTKNESQINEWLSTENSEHTLMFNGWEPKMVQKIKNGYVIEGGYLYKTLIVDKENFEKNTTCNFENYKLFVDESSITRTTCAYPIYERIIDISS